MADIYWTTLPDVSRTMKWPVRVEDWGPDKPLIYNKSDDAYFNVSRAQLVEFNTLNLDAYRTKGLGVLKRKKHTSDMFQADIAWALTQLETPIRHKLRSRTTSAMEGSSSDIETVNKKRKLTKHKLRSRTTDIHEGSSTIENSMSSTDINEGSSTIENSMPSTDINEGSSAIENSMSSTDINEGSSTIKNSMSSTDINEGSSTIENSMPSTDINEGSSAIENSMSSTDINEGSSTIKNSMSSTDINEGSSAIENSMSSTDINEGSSTIENSMSSTDINEGSSAIENSMSTTDINEGSSTIENSMSSTDINEESYTIENSMSTTDINEGSSTIENSMSSADINEGSSTIKNSMSSTDINEGSSTIENSMPSTDINEGSSTIENSMPSTDINEGSSTIDNSMPSTDINEGSSAIENSMSATDINEGSSTIKNSMSSTDINEGSSAIENSMSTTDTNEGSSTIENSMSSADINEGSSTIENSMSTTDIHEWSSTIENSMSSTDINEESYTIENSMSTTDINEGSSTIKNSMSTTDIHAGSSTIENSMSTTDIHAGSSTIVNSMLTLEELPSDVLLLILNEFGGGQILDPQMQEPMLTTDIQTQLPCIGDQLVECSDSDDDGSIIYTDIPINKIINVVDIKRHSADYDADQIETVNTKRKLTKHEHSSRTTDINEGSSTIENSMSTTDINEGSSTIEHSMSTTDINEGSSTIENSMSTTDINEGSSTIENSMSSTDVNEGSSAIEKDIGVPPIKEQDKIKDVSVPSIFIRKIQVSNVTKNGVKKKHGRLQNSYHACFMCDKMVQHIPTHMKLKHSDEKEVQDIVNLQEHMPSGEKKQAITLKQNILRAKGDHKHNTRVLNEQEGELLLFRRPTEAFDHNDYGPCPSCMDWMLLNSMPKHQKKCPVRLAEKESGVQSSVPRKRELLLQTKIILDEIPQNVSKLMVKEVFSIMTPDSVTETAKADPLIVALGESWLRRSIDNQLKRKYYASQHMRHCAKLLIELRKSATNDNEECRLQMWDFLRPVHFDKLVHAALQTAIPDMDDFEELKSPSNAIKIKYDILRMLLCKLAISVKELDKCTDEVPTTQWKRKKKEAEDCKFLMDCEWSERVTRLARSILEARRIGKTVTLPKPEDVQLLGKYLVQQIQSSDLSTDSVTWETYSYITKLVQSRLLMYNKRRSGEIEGIRIKDYLKQKNVDDVDQALMGQLSKLDRYLLESQALIETRGKRGRTVPVLIPKDSLEAMEYLANASVRKQADVLESNVFLFANRDRNGVQRVYEAVQRTSEDAGLQSPERITSVNMRKYMATLAQVLDLNDAQLDWVCKHLGHSKSVHLQHYRTSSPFIERVHVGKILLMQQMNIQNKFVGKKLSDIDFMDIIDIRNRETAGDTAENAEDEVVEAQAELTEAEVTEAEAELTEAEVAEAQVAEDEEDIYSFTETSTCQKKKAKKAAAKSSSARKAWSETENAELKMYLKKNFDAKKTPGQHECIAAKQKSLKEGGQLHKRHWHTIVSKVSAMLMKAKRLTDF